MKRASSIKDIEHGLAITPEGIKRSRRLMALDQDSGSIFDHPDFDLNDEDLEELAEENEDDESEGELKMIESHNRLNKSNVVTLQKENECSFNL